MYISRLQVEEGFLDGLDVEFGPGLNVLIGARGTGKSSVIELIRFCLGAKSLTTEGGNRSHQHATSVLGSGQVSVIIEDDLVGAITVTRAASDLEPRITVPFESPLIFSQSEIEAVGLQARGRLRLLDGFVTNVRGVDTEENAAISEIRSLTAEIESARRALDELQAPLADLPQLEQQLLALTESEKQSAGVSYRAAELLVQLEQSAKTLADYWIANTIVDRSRQDIQKIKSAIAMASKVAIRAEKWPLSDIPDPTLKSQQMASSLQRRLAGDLNALDVEDDRLAKAAGQIAAGRKALDDTTRKLRQEVDEIQRGTGALARQMQSLRERKAQLQSILEIWEVQLKDLSQTIERRNAALERLDQARERRFHLRSVACETLTNALGPRLRVSVLRAGQYEEYTAALMEALRGSGLRYNELAPALASNMSPRELLEAVDAQDAARVCSATGISKERAQRALGQLRNCELGAIATSQVNDSVTFQLLDGTSYKDITELSTGQRCTVILPVILRHTERVIVIDQPEDHIDNAFIAETLIKSLLDRSSNGQILVTTHNANIPVLGNANHVVQLGSDGKRGFVVNAGPLDDPQVVAAIEKIMEGGAEAFRRRAEFYNRPV